MGTDIETHGQELQRERERLETISYKCDVSIKCSSSELREPLQKRKQKMCKSQKGHRTPEEQNPLNQQA